MPTDEIGQMCCVLSDSRVLIGGCSENGNSTYIEMFRVESGPCISSLHRIHVPEAYRWFSATSGSDMLVAMTYPKSPNLDQSVRVHRLRVNQLQEFARVDLNMPLYLIWLADRLLATKWSDET